MVCEHVKEIRLVEPDAEGCSDCLAVGDRWVHLRMCLTCGHVACCDSSKNQHARRHWHRTQHPIVRSAQPGEDWRWCYPDGDYLDPEGEWPVAT
jgi:CPA2 family monovalent cation:H+ antiporter-2